MKIALIGSFSPKFFHSSKLSEISEMEEKLNVFMQNRTYCDLVDEISIIIFCCEPEMEILYPISRPKYVAEQHQTIHSVLDVHLYKILMFNLRVEYESFYYSDKEEGLRIISQAILETLESLKYPVKLKKFDKLGFYNDLKTFFINEGLIDVNN
ncbi:hypothetical protein [Macellibacteroides fermentans]|uniref:hypothetical protein n=1 Tax=Macellibacteroides fermentans TaxID=879969 RepID=UPI00406CA42D